MSAIPATPETAVPYNDIANQEFWAGTRRGELLMRRCRSCAALHWYPRPLCPYCMGETAWEKASGDGRIYALAVDRTAVPARAVAYVQLAEGVTLLTNIVDCDVEALAIGQPVRVRFKDSDSGNAVLPMFTLA